MQNWFPVEWSVRFIINGFFLPINEHCSKVFFGFLTVRPTPKFLFKTLVKPLFSIAMRQGKKILEMRSKHIRRFGSGKKVSTLDLLLQRKEFLRETDEVHIYV